MTGERASWQLLDVESEPLPQALAAESLPGGGAGRIVALAATPFAQRDQWAARAAVRIARSWAGQGLRIVLMDLGLEHPSLHTALGLPNEEGVSDAFLYGASIERIARPALDGALFFASAGSAAADPEAVLAHPRWNDLAGGFSEADATLVLFLPTDIAGHEAVYRLATDIILLCAEDEAVQEVLGPAEVKRVAAVGPEGLAGPSSEEPAGQEALAEREEGPEAFPGAPLEAEDWGVATELPEPAEPAPAAPGREDDTGLEIPDFGAEFADLPPLESEVTPGAGGWEAGTEAPGEPEEGAVGTGFGEGLVQGADFGGAGQPRAAELGEEPPATAEAPTAPSEPPSEEPSRPRATHPPMGRERPRPPRRLQPPPRKRLTKGRAIGLSVVILFLVAAGGTAAGVFSVPGLTFLQGYFAELPDPELSLPGPQPNEPVLRYSLELFRYEPQELADAMEMRDALRSRLPELLFTLVPQERDGVLTYALLAGPATDRVEVENLRGPLAAVLTREDPESWPVRETPRAFYLGERETLSEAQAYLGSIESDEVPGYILHVTYPDGSEGFEVLSGAYQGVADARPLQRILHRNGFRDAPLIERRGRFPE